jgi:hypothetical protein
MSNTNTEKQVLDPTNLIPLKATVPSTFASLPSLQSALPAASNAGSVQNVGAQPYMAVNGAWVPVLAPGTASVCADIISRYEVAKGNNARVNAFIPSAAGAPAANAVGYTNSGVNRSGYNFISLSAGVTNSFPSNGGALLKNPVRFYGGFPFAGSSNICKAASYYLLSATDPNNSGTRAVTQTGRLVFVTDEPKPIIKSGGDATKFVLNINDGSGWKRVVDPALAAANPVNSSFQSNATGGLWDTQLDATNIGGRKRRIWEIVFHDDFGIVEVGIGPTSTWYDPPTSPKMLLLADSLGGTVSRGNGIDAYPAVLQDILDVHDLWMLSEGGTGFINTNSGTSRTHLQKLQLAATMPQLADIQIGYLPPSVNDASYSAAQITAAATDAIRYAVSTWPGVLWIVPGPTASNDTTNQATMIVVENAVIAAVNAVNSPYVKFLPMMTDPNGQAIKGTGNSDAPAGNGNADYIFNNSDGVHFSSNGHLVWGKDRVAPGIINLLRKWIGEA